MSILAVNRILLRNSFYLRFLENLGHVLPKYCSFKSEQRLMLEVDKKAVISEEV